MSGLKDSWKETGTGLGHAFRDLGKTVIKSAKTGADKASDWASKDDSEKEMSNEETLVHASSEEVGIAEAFSETEGTKQESTGLKESWKQTGTGLGHAFRDLGKTVIKSAKTGAEKATDWASKDEQQNEEKKES